MSLTLDKLKLDAVLICEGKYDKIKLSSIFDCLIITTDGFSIFKNDKKLNLIRDMSKNKDIIIVTDSDKAGFKIRNYIKNCIHSDRLYNVFIPEIYGKEKRKKIPSKEGKLGLEGIEKKLIISLFDKFIFDKNMELKKNKEFSKTFLYNIGLIGHKNSYNKRLKLLNYLSLPTLINTNTLVDILNLIYKKDYIEKLIEELEL